MSRARPRSRRVRSLHRHRPAQQSSLPGPRLLQTGNSPVQVRRLLTVKPRGQHSEQEVSMDVQRLMMTGEYMNVAIKAGLCSCPPSAPTGHGYPELVLSLFSFGQPASPAPEPI